MEKFTEEQIRAMKACGVLDEIGISDGKEVTLTQVLSVIHNGYFFISVYPENGEIFISTSSMLGANCIGHGSNIYEAAFYAACVSVISDRVTAAAMATIQPTK